MSAADIRSDPVAIALGLVEDKHWPEDAPPEYLPPYYWREVIVEDQIEVLHVEGCSRLDGWRGTFYQRDLQVWFAACGKTLREVLALPWVVPCSECGPR